VAPLTLTELRTAARLVRADVEGAAEQLVGLALTRGDALSRLLGIAPHQLDALASSPNAAARIAAAIESVPGARRPHEARADAGSARPLAHRLAASAIHRDDGSVALDVAVLRALVELRTARVLRFGARGTVDGTRLRAILRALRHPCTVSVVLMGRALVVTHQARHARGHIRLYLQADTPRAEALDVPVGAMTAPEGTLSDTRETVSSDSGEIGEIPPGADFPVPRVPPTRPILHAFLTALHDALTRSAA
jgi:hypothetical protein